MEKCRICGHSTITILSNCKSKLGEVYSLKKCQNCSFISVDPLPSYEDLKKYYDDDYWQKTDKIKGKLLDWLYRFRMASIIKDIKKLAPLKSRILDWGAGDGSLVKILNERGFDCWGIDLYSIKPNNEKIINTSIEKADFKNGYFSAITCFHVLEHIINPKEAVKRAFELLEPGGILVVEVPNIQSFSFKIFKRRWYPLQIPIHLNHFTLKSLKYLLKETENIEVLKTSFFSHRVSPSNLVVSIFPFLAPMEVRKKHRGSHPFYLMVIYLFLQILAYPLVIIESFLKQGTSIRLIIKKTGTNSNP